MFGAKTKSNCDLNVLGSTPTRSTRPEHLPCLGAVFGFHGVDKLTPVSDNINTDKYISIKDNNLSHVVARH